MRSKRKIKRYRKKLIKRLLQVYPFYKKIRITFHTVSMEIFGISLYQHRGLGKDFPRNLCHEPICSEYVIDFLNEKPASVFWDCGSAVGYYSLLAKHASNNQAEVHAFEANPFFNKYIKKSKKAFTEGFFAVTNTKLDHKTEPGHLALDTYADENGFPDIIKMDLDGFESNALRGMSKIFEQSNPVLLLEVHFKGNYKSRLNIITESIPARKYKFSICINHRYKDAYWQTIENLSELPLEKQEHMADNDYVLLCIPE